MPSLSQSLAIASRDAANIYLETDRSPANIISIAIAATPTVTHADMVRWMTDRLHCSPHFLRRLHRTWGDLTSPSWRATTIGVGAHVTVTPAPDWTAAQSVISELVAARMDLSRPPWDLTVITGVRGLGDDLPDPASILVFRFHHSIGDGVAVAAIIRRMLTETPEAAPALPSGPGALRELAAVPAGLARYVGALVRAPHLAREAPPAVAGVGTRFNQPTTGRPTVGFVHFDVDAIRSIRALVPGSTLNDVMLTVVSGAIGRVLAECKESATGLSVLMPIAVDDEDGAANQFALGVTAIHADVADPVERLRRVHAATAGEKERQRHPAVVGQRSLAGEIPPWVTRITGGLARPAHGVGSVSMVSNVPSRLADATFMGGRVVDRVSFLTVGDGARLAHFISSVGHRVTMSYTMDDQSLPDPSEYAGVLRAVFAELAGATEVAAK